MLGARSCVGCGSQWAFCSGGSAKAGSDSSAVTSTNFATFEGPALNGELGAEVVTDFKSSTFMDVTRDECNGNVPGQLGVCGVAACTFGVRPAAAAAGERDDTLGDTAACAAETSASNPEDGSDRGAWLPQPPAAAAGAVPPRGVALSATDCCAAEGGNAERDTGERELFAASTTGPSATSDLMDITREAGKGCTPAAKVCGGRVAGAADLGEAFDNGFVGDRMEALLATDPTLPWLAPTKPACKTRAGSVAGAWAGRVAATVGPSGAICFAG